MKIFIIILTTLFASFCISHPSHENRRPSQDQHQRFKHGKVVEVTSTSTTVVTSTTITTLRFDVNSTETGTETELRVIGGEETIPNKFPFLVSLQTYPDNHFCAGTIINPGWVLTAAHCLTGVDLQSIKVKAGKHSLSTEERTEQVRNVQAVSIHPKYHLHDAALVKLDIPFAIDSLSVRYKPPAAEDFEPDYNSFGTIVGWGEVEEDGQLSDVLQEITVPLIPPEICTLQYKNLSSISTSHICAGGNGAGMCSFDDGGPLLCSPHDHGPINDNFDTIFCGIASWSAGCGKEDFSGIFTRVSSIHSWIYNTIMISETPKEPIDEKVLSTETEPTPSRLTTTIPPPIKVPGRL